MTLPENIAALVARGRAPRSIAQALDEPIGPLIDELCDAIEADADDRADAANAALAEAMEHNTRLLQWQRDIPDIDAAVAFLARHQSEKGGDQPAGYQSSTSATQPLSSQSAGGAESAAPAQEGGWRTDMENAPRNGRLILMVDGQVREGGWSTKLDCFYVSPLWRNGEIIEQGGYPAMNKITAWRLTTPPKPQEDRDA